MFVMYNLSLAIRHLGSLKMKRLGLVSVSYLGLGTFLYIAIVVKASGDRKDGVFGQ